MSARLVSAVVAATGIAMALPGAWLLFNGGSGYYLSAGLALVGSGLLAFRQRKSALWIYSALLMRYNRVGALGGRLRFLGPSAAARIPECPRLMAVVGISAIAIGRANEQARTDALSGDSAADCHCALC